MFHCLGRWSELCYESDVASVDVLFGFRSIIMLLDSWSMLYVLSNGSIVWDIWCSVCVCSSLVSCIKAMWSLCSFVVFEFNKYCCFLCLIVYVDVATFVSLYVCVCSVF